MSTCSEWIEDILEEARDSEEALSVVAHCGAGCARRQNAEAGMLLMKEKASCCKTKSDYAAFLKHAMPVEITEDEDGIIMHLGKKECTCPISSSIKDNADMLCECTRGHEEACWSIFFGKPVKVEILESFLRGGKDCVIKIIP